VEQDLVRRRAPRLSGWLMAARAARKVAISTLGGAILVVGVVLLPLPGPGMLVVFLGLAILSTEYSWPKRLAHYLRRRAAQFAERRRERRRAKRG
jgi:uncharacterized protein (TIGR02611 family)